VGFEVPLEFYLSRIYSEKVHLSICLTHALWQNRRTYCRYFDNTRKGNHSSYLTLTEIGGRCPLPPEIGTQSDPPLKNADFDQYLLIKSEPLELAKNGYVELLCTSIYLCVFYFFVKMILCISGLYLRPSFYHNN